MQFRRNLMVGNLLLLCILQFFGGGSAFGFRLGGRWTNTASHGFVPLGSPVTLTWGIIGDGTTISGEGGSNMISYMDTQFGAGPGGSDLTQRPWFNLFSDPFDRWAELTGLSYVYEPNDDGVTQSIAGNAGILGVRPDVRIGGAFLDGNNGVLAFNFFPNNGDMVIDTGDVVNLTNSAGDFRTFRNIIAHEHGHGIGLNHVDSSNSRQLMEPFIQIGFSGPQLDDILGAHRGYGDFFEKSNNGAGNDTASLATPLGLIDDGQTVSRGIHANNVRVFEAENDFVSIDDNGDTDFFSFTIDSPADVDLLLTPLGPTYNEGPQNGTQTPFDTSEMSNLNLALFDTNGTSLLASDNSGGLGETDSISAFSLSTPGQYFARIQGDANNVQMYRLDITVTETATVIDGDFDDDGDYDCADVDALVGDIVGAGTPGSFDLNGDGAVDTTDLDAWLAEAGAANLASGNPFLPGDANLDGSVDVSDFNLWNGAKFTSTPEWCSGDFNADGLIDVSDFNIWNGNKFQAADAVSAVPEPSALAMLLVLATGLLQFRPRRS